MINKLQIIIIEIMPFRRIWTQKQDITLKYLREDLNIQRWSLIAQKLQNQYGILGRNQKQCRQRYHNHLDSSLNLQKLSSDQEKQLFYLHNQYGNRWAEIAKNFQGRTDASLKNIFHSKLRKGIRKVNRFLKGKSMEDIRPYPLNIVCKIMEKSQQKNIVQQNQNNINANFFRTLQNELIEFSGCITSTPSFVGWSEKKIIQHLILMLEKIKDPKDEQQSIQNEQMSSQSEYQPFKQRKSSISSKKSIKPKQAQRQTFFYNMEDLQKGYQKDSIQNIKSIKTQTSILEKESDQIENKILTDTQLMQSQLQQNQCQKYGFALESDDFIGLEEFQNMDKILKELNQTKENDEQDQLSQIEQITDFKIDRLIRREPQQLFEQILNGIEEYNEEK